MTQQVTAEELKAYGVSAPILFRCMACGTCYISESQAQNCGHH